MRRTASGTTKDELAMVLLEITETAERALGRQANVLRELDHLSYQEQQSIRHRLALKNLHQIQELTETNARRIAIEAIKHGFISRVEAASMLGVHQGTVARWVKDTTDKEVLDLKNLEES